MLRFVPVLAICLFGTLPSLRAQDDARQLAGQAREVFKQFCLRCHSGQVKRGGDLDVLREETFALKSSTEKAYVVPGKPDESYLLELMFSADNPMPKRGTKEAAAITDADRQTIRKWIAAGAPSYRELSERKPIEFVQGLQTIHDHLRQCEEEDRPYQRYFTLTHLHNNPGVPEIDLRAHRAALSKALNSLSWKPDIVLPRAIDRDETIFVLDVRDLDWDRGNLWNRILERYPYGVRYRGVNTNFPGDGAVLRRLDNDLAQMTGCDLPYVRADWFVATATRPDLYHLLLKLPTTAGELETRLGVDVAANFQRDRLVRAGFTASKVSKQNRLVERHASLFGVYWKSYDFKADSPRNNLKTFPLGPNLAGNPYEKQFFSQDGGEMIFSLPNGLHGYMLVDNLDARINAGPIAVVQDLEQNSGNAEIVNGLSCIACHKHGMIDVKDEIRIAHALGGGAPARKVERLYPPRDRMNELLALDRQRYLAALEKAIGPFLRIGADRERKLESFPEPVTVSTSLYLLQDLDATTVACELGLTKPDDFRQAIRFSEGLQKLGLRSLGEPGGVLKRKEWERVDGASLMQRAAQVHHKAVPVTP